MTVGISCLNCTYLTETRVKLKVSCSIYTYIHGLDTFLISENTAWWLLSPTWVSKYSAPRWFSWNVEINQLRNGRSTIYISSYFTMFLLYIYAKVLAEFGLNILLKINIPKLLVKKSAKVISSNKSTFLL